MAAADDSSQGGNGDEGYIDMELRSPPRSREFEFQTFPNPKQKEAKTCTADELFHKGKLLPLHLIAAITARDKTFEASGAATPMACATAPCTSPLDSCNISPSESRRVSCELMPGGDATDDCFFEWSTELSSFIHSRDRRKKSWAQKLKLVRNYSFAQKLKASRAYFKSLFHKSDTSEAEKIDDNSSEFAKKKPFEFTGMAKNSYYPPTIAAIIKNGNDENVPRRSFSGAIKRHSPAKCLSSSSSDSSSSSSSSSSSLCSNSLQEVNAATRRSSSATEAEDSIEAAIAHCKESQRASILGQKPEVFRSLCAYDR